ncbi:MAG: DUF262 domain-containing HNH endonuclease family protein [Verrucomicrobiaceae bacterium]
MNNTHQEDQQNFESIFISRFSNRSIKVPDYQRAYSWETKQIDLFIGDLVNPANRHGYYFGHFIVEDSGSHLELVDGQQRLTTVILFLVVCHIKRPELLSQGMFDLLTRFETVGYDQPVLRCLIDKSLALIKTCGTARPEDEAIIESLGLSKESFTLSQQRMALAVWHFHRAFEKGHLEASQIPDYIQMLAGSLCSCHIAKDKTVAVNIFEMHNTRGVPLKLIEVVKAKLMKAVYDDGGPQRDNDIKAIQAEFAIIHAFEERLSASSFRGEMTLEGILRHHLRVVDDGIKKSRDEMDKPAKNANTDDLIHHISSKLEAARTSTASGNKRSTYAKALAVELRKSVQIVCDFLPKWDSSENLVGDVMILHRGLSCEFFLLVCRKLSSEERQFDGTVSKDTLRLWEKLLFTHDFHGRYHNLKGARDDFPRLFSELGQDDGSIAEVIEKYVKKGFREDRTGGDLQKVVLDDLDNEESKKRFLNRAFGWWRGKIIYALYKYEISQREDLRRIMKGTISVEHILPQEWQWDWIEKDDCPPKAFASEQDREKHRREFSADVSTFIDGLGNLLLVTREENSALSNEHPAQKSYLHICNGGSYQAHEANRERWRNSSNWKSLIQVRGEQIFDFILNTMLK